MLFRSIPAWREDLAWYAGRPNLRVLEIGSFEGLASVWLLRNILTDETCRLVSIGRYEIDSWPTLTYQRNLNSQDVQKRVSIHRGSLSEILTSFDGLLFDFICIDHLLTTSEFLELPLLAWKLLKTGGVMIIDDHLLSSHPIYSVMSPLCKPEAGIDRLLSTHQTEYVLLRDAYHMAVRKV